MGVVYSRMPSLLYSRLSSVSDHQCKMSGTLKSTCLLLPVEMYWSGTNKNCFILALLHRRRKSLSIKFYIPLTFMRAVIFSTFRYRLTSTPFSLKLPPNCCQSFWGEDVVICYRDRLEDAGPLSFDTWRASRCCWPFCFVKLLRNDSAMVL